MEMVCSFMTASNHAYAMKVNTYMNIVFCRTLYVYYLPTTRVPLYTSKSERDILLNENVLMAS